MTQFVSKLSIFPSCHVFIDECSKVFDCINQQKLCDSTKFGEETRNGFLVDDYISFDQLHTNVGKCPYWGVDFKTEENDSRYCFAKRLFKVKTLTFCQSYEWACMKLIHCLRQRQTCHYVYDASKNFSSPELLGKGLVNIPMPGFSPRENPRKHVPLLYRCNVYAEMKC